MSTSDNGDYIKQIKILNFRNDADLLKFSFIDKPKVGSKAIFSIFNSGTQDLYCYPNNAFFFGTLYAEGDKDSWSQHYPRYINIEYCDTVSAPKPLRKDQKTNAWTPNDNDCSPFIFKMKGNYFFEILYTINESSLITFQGTTKLLKANVYRQIFEFTI